MTIQEDAKPDRGEVLPKVSVNEIYTKVLGLDSVVSRSAG